jgi:hypothetical protein
MSAPSLTVVSEAEQQTAPVNRLQKLIEDRRAVLGGTDGPLSVRELQRRSDYACSYETWGAIIRGRHAGKVSDRVAAGMAKALGVPVEKVYEAAGLLPVGTRWEMPAYLWRLGPREREAVEDIAAKLLQMYDQGRNDR